MKKTSLCLLFLLRVSILYSQESPTLSANNSFSTINIRANTSTAPVIRFSRWTGANSLQHNAFVGQFFNTALGEYSLGIGTGLSATGDQNMNNTILTTTLSGNVGIGTSTPGAKLDVGSFIPGGTLGTVLGRLQEGNSSGAGTLLGVKGYETQPTNAKSFALEHSFYGTVNSSINFHRGGGVTGGFMTFNTDANVERMRIAPDGNVGIGTTTPDTKLAVKGTMHAQEVKVDLSVPGPDYVFDNNYKLLSLEEIRTYIDKNKHLPEVPSAKEMEANGVNLGAMNMLLLKKIEELTLYVIEQNEIILKQNNRITILENNQ